MTVSINNTSFPDDGRKYGKESKDNNDKSHNDGDSDNNNHYYEHDFGHDKYDEKQ